MANDEKNEEDGGEDGKKWVRLNDSYTPIHLASGHVTLGIYPHAFNRSVMSVRACDLVSPTTTPESMIITGLSRDCVTDKAASRDRSA